MKLAGLPERPASSRRSCPDISTSRSSSHRLRHRRLVSLVISKAREISPCPSPAAARRMILTLIAICCEGLERLNSFSKSAFSDSLRLSGAAVSGDIALKSRTLYLYIVNRFTPSCTSYAKPGTTWLQQITAQLLWNGVENLEVSEMSPWLDLRVPPKAVKFPEVEAQVHRRFIKTHLPVDALGDFVKRSHLPFFHILNGH